MSGVRIPERGDDWRRKQEARWPTASAVFSPRAEKCEPSADVSNVVGRQYT
jgi:hypothetical protein